MSRNLPATRSETGRSLGPVAARPPSRPPPGRHHELRMPILAGMALILIFFVGLGTWALVAPIASAAIAPGVVSPDGNRRIVQHLEGGIIEAIEVRDGAQVRAGEPLIVLRETQARANYELLQGQRRTLAAIQARLLAEQAGLAEIAFPGWLVVDEAADPEATEILEAQRNLFETRRAAHIGRKNILDQRIAQLREEINGLEAQVKSQDRQLALMREEIANVKTLLDKGLERRPRFLELQAREAGIGGARAENLSRIARAKQRIGETKLEIVSADTERLDRIASELARVNTELSAIEERLFASDDILKRTVITAPVSGTVVNLRVNTPGGVIGAGDPLLDIVPADDDLVIDARLSPLDIDVVYPGLTAQVHLLAYSQRRLPRIDGVVRSVSADSLQDQITGQHYFKAQVEVKREDLDALAGNVKLVPGMPAEVLIVTGERTAFDYLTQPLRNAFRRAFRET